MKSQKIFNYPLFALGFRAFFMLAAISALVFLVLWNTLIKGDWSAINYFPNNLWHAHEMLLGYSVAVLSGFLLTAVKNWTEKSTLTGDALAGLCLIWLYGRIVPFYADLLPNVLIALIDFAFLPILIYQISKPIVQTKQYQHLIFVVLLVILAFANGLIHYELLGFSKNSATLGVNLVLATFITLIVIIAGRVFPYFIERGLSGTLIIKNNLLDQLIIGVTVITFACQVFTDTPVLTAWLAIIAAIIHTIRLAKWYDRKIWYVPLLWILFLGYGWLILGFILTALAEYRLVLPSLALHSFTVGSIGVLTLGMMARVSLGHTGRALKISNSLAIAFIFINLAVVFRVLLPIAMKDSYTLFIYVSTLCWLVAFSLFACVYSPILSSPRIDEQAQ